MAKHRPLSLWTVYDHPRDFPNNFIAREWRIGGGKTTPTANIIIAADLDMLREVLLTQLHLTRLMRSDDDDPVIVETWI